MDILHNKMCYGDFKFEICYTEFRAGLDEYKRRFKNIGF